MPHANVRYCAVHENTAWRKVLSHTSLESALFGKKDGAPGLFKHRARIDYVKHGEPLFVVVWEEGKSTGFIVKSDSSSSDGTTRVPVDARLLQQYDANGGASIAELEAHFSSSTINQASSGISAQETLIDEAEEGALLLKKHLVRERNSSLVASKKASVLAATGCLACEACEFDFMLIYGEIGVNYCEVHHTEPLCRRKGTEKTSLQDLAILCSNCHSIIHRTLPMLSVSALAAHMRAIRIMPL
jgi:5-methylcytosine-specific restriction protein A